MPYPVFNPMQYQQDLYRYPNSLLQGVQPGVQPKYEIVHVNGKSGAEAFQMPPNSQILLLDETAPIVWFKSTDGAGYPTLTAYDIVPARSPEQKETDRYNTLEQRIATLEVLVADGLKPNSRNSKPKQAGLSDTTD